MQGLNSLIQQLASSVANTQGATDTSVAACQPVGTALPRPALPTTQGQEREVVAGGREDVVVRRSLRARTQAGRSGHIASSYL